MNIISKHFDLAKIQKAKLYKVKEMLHELIEVGEDYSVFQSAQITHKNLKKAYKLLQGLS